MRRLLILAASLSILVACNGEKSPDQGAAVEQKSELTAVRLIGPRVTLDKMANAAAQVRWTEHSYDAKGRLILPAPANYTSDDFGRLLQAIEPYTQDLQGLQMLGPNGGPVDDKGIEHPDE